MVNELVDLLEKDEDIDRIYELWYQAKCAVYATYTDNPPPRKPLSQEEAFKPIRNAMIKEADELGKILHTLDEEQKQTSGDAPEKSDDDKASKGGGASHTTCNTAAAIIFALCASSRLILAIVISILPLSPRRKK